uniref:Spermidine synthase n=1 Tax=Desulfomonile tiedjei TaxID=2358 RepID=A0A7C4EUK9_9BACT
MNRNSKTYYLPSVLIISAAVLAWQLGLMRCLLITRYHHFSFLIISCALLGYGIGGAVLSSFQQWFAHHGEAFFRWGCLGLGVSIPICFYTAERLPLQVFFPPEDLLSSIFWWALYWVIQSCPFVLVGALTGWALGGKAGRVNVIYACSLIGASLGVMAGMLFLSYYAPNSLAVLLGIVVSASCIGLIPALPSRAAFAYGVCVFFSLVGLAICLLVDADKVFPLRIDQYKSLAHVQRLAAQNAARRLQVFDGLRGRVELYASPHFHTLLSLASPKRLPPMDILIKDGVQIGTIPVVKNLGEVKFLDETLFAIPYHLVRPRRVLILGEAGAIHLWNARLHHPDLILFVQPDENVARVLAGHPSRPLDDPTIHVIISDARTFLEKTHETFDVIQLAELEGFAPGTSGIGGLRENYLATVQGFRKCLERLTPGGVACTVRGIQDPPRDNIKILGTWFEALRADKSLDPASHLIMARDELACAILCWKSPVTPEVGAQIAQKCHDNCWELEWAPHVHGIGANRVHMLPGPTGSSVSWYHEAITKFQRGQDEQFYRNWIAHVRPATDDIPYFFDFFRIDSISHLKRQFGPLWAARSEMGFLVLLTCLAATVIAATLFLVTALFGALRSAAQPFGRGLLWVISFFGMIGTAFMFVEMLLIQAFTRLLGDPVIAAGVVLGELLLFSGLGSMLEPRLTRQRRARMFAAGALAGVMLFLAHAGLSVAQSVVSGLALPYAMALSIAVIGPIGFLMGIPFPWAMARVNKNTPAAAPLAWAVNCFASVISSPLAIVAAMSLGFRFLWTTGSLLYGLVGLLALAASWGSNSDAPEAIGPASHKSASNE